MNIVKLIDAWLKQKTAEQKQRQLEEAHKVITDAGLYVCCIKEVAGTLYMVDGKGTQFKIGRGK